MRIMGNRRGRLWERLQKEMKKSSIIGMIKAKILPLKNIPCRHMLVKYSNSVALHPLNEAVKWLIHTERLTWSDYNQQIDIH